MRSLFIGVTSTISPLMLVWNENPVDLLGGVNEFKGLSEFSTYRDVRGCCEEDIESRATMSLEIIEIRLDQIEIKARRGRKKWRDTRYTKTDSRVVLW